MKSIGDGSLSDVLNCRNVLRGALALAAVRETGRQWPGILVPILGRYTTQAALHGSRVPMFAAYRPQRFT